MPVDIIIVFILIALGYIFGSMNERRHYRSIIKQKKKYQELFIHNTQKRVTNPAVQGHLVMGNVVVSVDYFKRIVAGLRNIFGGKVSSYESLLDLVRR